MNREAMPGMDGDLSQLEVLAEPDRNPACVYSLEFPGRDLCLHDVARPEPFLELLARRVPDGETVFVRPAAVPLAMPVRLDQQRPHACDSEVSRRAGTNAGRIEPVRLGQTSHRAVPFGPTARPALDGHSRCLETSEQLPPCGVDRRSVPERRLGLSLNPGQDFGLALEEVLDRAVALAAVTGFARQRQVGDPVGSAVAPGVDVLDLERDAGLATVGARAMPFLQEVLADFVTRQCPLLVLDSGDLRVLDLLQVESC